MVDQARLNEILSKLSPEAVELLRSNPELCEMELDARSKHFPSKNWVPNIAQERSLEWARQRYEATKDFSKENLFIAGNGVGKTCSIPMLLAGSCLGPEFLNPEYFANHEFFHYCKAVRRERPLRVRLVCDGADMEENGSLCQQLKKWLPCAKMAGKTGGLYYTSVTIPAPVRGFYPTVCDVKTHGMPQTAHAGPDYDLVVFNEPPPKSVYAENASRIRTGGYLCAFLTPLNMAGYLLGIINSERPEGTLTVTNGSIWDNCKDVPGTRGILSRANVEDQIRRWEALDPLQVPARRDGKFIQLAGAVFKIFNRNIHVIPPRPIPQSWNNYMGVDHHPKKPALGLWAARDQLNNWYIIAEYPTDQWDRILNTPLTIKNFVSDFEKIENGQNSQFPYMKNIYVRERVPDPNSFAWRQANTGRTVREDYEWHSGWTFSTNVDNDIELRHSRIKDLLLYDPSRAIDSLNTPKLFIFSSCHNMIRAAENYCYKTNQGDGEGLSDKLEETWKDWWDVFGYIVTTVDDSYDPSKVGENESDDYAQIRKSRDPFCGDPNVLRFRESSYAGERWL